MNDILFLILFFLIVLCGFFIQGITGFGANLFTMSFAILFLPRTHILPICLLFTFLQTTYIVYKSYKAINIKQFVTILSLAMICGMPLGVATVDYLNETFLKGLLSLFIFIYSGKELFNIHKEVKYPNSMGKMSIMEFMLPILSGAFETAFGSGGPLIMAYLSRKIHDKDSLRTTVALYWTVLNGIILIWGLFIDNSLILNKELMLAALPAVVIGQIFSNFVSQRLSYKRFCITLHSVLIMSAILILAQIALR